MTSGSEFAFRLRFGGAGQWKIPLSNGSDPCIVSGPMPTGKSPAASSPPPDFESAMQRLEAIVERIESTRLPLNELLASYEEGTKLVKACTDHLAAAEKRIEIITRA